MTEMETAVLEAVADLPKVTSHNELAAYMGRPAHFVRDTLSDLTTRGYLTRLVDGSDCGWRLSPKAKVRLGINT